MSICEIWGQRFFVKFGGVAFVGGTSEQSVKIFPAIIVFLANS